MTGEIVAGLRRSNAGLTPPPPWLAGYVVGYAVDESAVGIRSWCVPDGRVVAVVDVGAAPRRLVEAAEQPLSPVVGLHDRPQVVETLGQRCSMAVLLTPWGAHMLFGVGMHELTNVHVSMNDLLGRAARELSERLAEKPSWPQRFAVLDEALACWFSGRPAPHGEVLEAWQSLVDSSGTVSIQDLAQQVGWSRRRLESRFRDQIGLPPKTIARICRFHRAIDLLASGDRAGDVAIECGYWDQAHLNRDFRALAGRTPVQLVNVLNQGIALGHG